MSRLLVTGSRTWDDAEYVYRILDGLYAECGSFLRFEEACA